MAPGNTFNVRFEVSDDGRVTAHIADIRRQAQDAEPAVRTLGDRLGGVAGIMTGLFAGASGVVATAMGLVIKNTMDAERELAQLNAVLRSTGQDANFNAEQLTAMAESISRASTFSGGEITNAQTRLLSYSGIVTNNFAPALQAAIDQAARLGISVEQSAEIVGRALESPTKAAGALAQQGFGAAFTKSVRESIAALEQAGRTGEAQTIILDILNESYAGAAKAARDTLGGSLVALKNSFNDLMTGEGGSLDGTTEAVNRLTDTLQSEETKAAFAQVITWVADFTKEVVENVAQLTNWWSKAMEIRGIAQGGNPSGASLQALTERIQQNDNERRMNAEWNPWTDRQKAFKASEAARLEQERQLLNTESLRRLREATAPSPAPAGSGSATGKTAPIPKYVDEKEAARQAERIKRATQEMAGAQRDWQTELAAIGNPIIDEYNKRLTEIAERTEAAGRAKVPTEQIDAFTASMRELAQQIRDRDIAEFQREFDAETAEMAAQLEGPTAQALQTYTQLLKEASDALDAGVIGADRYAARQQVLADQMNAGAIQMLRDIAEEQQTLMLTSQELEVYNRLKQAGVEANSAYGQSIIEATVQLQRHREAAAVLGDVQAATHELASDAIFSFGSAGDAAERFGDRLKRIAANMLADRAVQQLFNAGMNLFGGSAATAYTGNGLGAGSTSGFGNNMEGFTGRNLYGFGGGRAAGGGVNRDTLYEVNEGGHPELLRQGNRTFLLPGSDGVVMPAAAAAAGGRGSAISAVAPVVNIRVHENADRGGADAVSAGGQLDIDVYLERKVQSMIASGRLDTVAAQKWGVQRRGVKGG